MKPFKALFGLITCSLLFGLASTQSLSLCSKLIIDPNEFIWAIGFSGDHFYVFGSDYSGYELEKTQVYLNSTFWICNLAKAKPMFISSITKPFPRENSYGIIGEVNNKHFIFVRHVRVKNEGVENTYTYIDLDKEELKEESLNYNSIKMDFQNETYFYNSDAGKFIVQDGDALFNGTFVEHGKFTVLSFDRSNVIGHIKHKGSTGFVQDGGLYVVNNDEKKMHKYELGANANSGRPMDRRNFSQIFDCSGHVFEKIALPKSKISDTFLIIAIAAGVVFVVALVLIVISFSPDSKEKHHKARDKKKNVAVDSSNTSSVANSLWVKVKMVGSSYYESSKPTANKAKERVKNKARKH